MKREGERGKKEGREKDNKEGNKEDRQGGKKAMRNKRTKELGECLTFWRSEFPSSRTVRQLGDRVIIVVSAQHRP